ncbi:MAG: response regulator transcription factor [Magnetospirillum sp.]|nr:response regulator transcription factor [Magnetospirillum sp.]
MRILIVEDEKDLATLLLRDLEADGYAVDAASTVAGGLAMATTVHYDIIILDLLLPDGSGTELLTALRQRRIDAPILVLTANGDLDTKVENFDAGADDCLTKPFAIAELLVRVRALLRRGPVTVSSTLKLADLEIDRLTHQVRRGGQRIELSPKEYSLLEYMMLHSGRALSRSMIVEHVWDQSFEDLSNIVDVYVRLLRRKIDDGVETKLIRTVRGVGYAIGTDGGP